VDLTCDKLDGRIIAEGKNAIWFPKFNPNRHAEIEALRNVPEELWKYSRNMTLYTTLEPCLMCTGAILLHHIVDNQHYITNKGSTAR
jgi:tRNA(adenine34) deaminase